MLNISQTSLDITNRFFEALAVLKREKRIRGLQTFTRMHGLNYGNMNTLKNHRDIRAMKPEYLAFLAKDFGVSCRWLLLGEGEMFTQTNTKT